MTWKTRAALDDHAGRIAALEAAVFAPPAQAADAPLAVGDRVEVIGPDCIGNVAWVGRVADVDEVDLSRMWPCAVMFEGIGRAWFPASSLRRIPAEPPAAEYAPGQAVEVETLPGEWRSAQVYGPIARGCWPVICDGEACEYLPQYIRPCRAVPGCVVQDVQSGAYGTVWGQMRVSLAEATVNVPFDPARHRVMLLPRQPATSPPVSCSHESGVRESRQPAPAEHPAEQPDLQREIEAALHLYDGEGRRDWEGRLAKAIRAAAAAPQPQWHSDGEMPHFRNGYNAGRDDVLRAILAALTGGKG